MRQIPLLSAVALVSIASVASASIKAGEPSTIKVFSGQNPPIFNGAESIQTVDIDLAGWQADGGFLNANNTFEFVTVGVGSQIVGAEVIDLLYTSPGSSWRSEFVLSLNDFDGVSQLGDFWDSRIAANIAANQSPGTFGPVSQPFNDPGLFASGPFTLTLGSPDLYVELYDTVNDTGLDQVVTRGTLRISYVPIPEPTTLAGLAVAGLVALRRTRR